MLTTIFGASLYAVATVTSVFLGGLALGAIAASRLIKGDGPNKFVAYAALEGLTALSAVGVTAILGNHWIPMNAAEGAISHLLRFLIVSVLLLPPTMLMGATLPVLVGAFVSEDKTTDNATQILYAANTTGGALGAIAAGFMLVPAIGLQASTIIAAVLNGIAGFGAVLAREAKPAPQPVLPAQSRANDPTKNASLRTMYVVAFLSGFILLQLEVCWTRWFSLILGSSVYSLSVVVATILIALALGAWAAKAILQPLGNALLLMASAYFLSTTYILITLYAANELPWTFISLSQSLSQHASFTFATSLAARSILIAAIIGVPVFLLGMVLPLLFGANVQHKPQFIGRIYAINTLGAICGALLTGFVLVPALSTLAETGIRWTVIFNLVAQILVACWLFIQWSRAFVTDPDTRSIVIGILIFVAAAVVVDVAVFRPEWNRAVASAGAAFFTPEDIHSLDKESFLAAVGALEGQDTIKFYREGLNATVTVGQDTHRNITFLKTDGKVEAAVPTNPAQPSKGADITTHELLAKLPLHVVPPANTNLNALLIGYGSGTTAGALLTDPRLGHLTIAELENAVYDANKFFAHSNNNPLANSKVRAITNDGRYILAASPEAYDIIVCQPSDPWVSGASELFTQNFWELAKTRLKANGVFAQWLPLYSLRSTEFVLLCKTFAATFPDCAIVQPARAGDCIMLGWNSERPLPAIDSPDATVVGADGIRKMVQFVRQSPNTDDHNIIEFAAARAAMTPEQNIIENEAILQHHAEIAPVLSR